MTNKLNSKTAAEILSRCDLRKQIKAQAKRLSSKALAEELGITPTAVQRIQHGWRGHTGRSYRGVTDADRQFLRECYVEWKKMMALADEHSVACLAAEYGVSESCVRRISSGRNWIRMPPGIAFSELQQ